MPCGRRVCPTVSLGAISCTVPQHTVWESLHCIIFSNTSLFSALLAVLSGAWRCRTIHRSVVDALSLVQASLTSLWSPPFKFWQMWQRRWSFLWWRKAPRTNPLGSRAGLYQGMEEKITGLDNTVGEVLERWDLSLLLQVPRNYPKCILKRLSCFCAKSPVHVS